MSSKLGKLCKTDNVEENSSDEASENSSESEEIHSDQIDTFDVNALPKRTSAFKRPTLRLVCLIINCLKGVTVDL